MVIISTLLVYYHECAILIHVTEEKQRDAVSDATAPRWLASPS
jgi:hypothetical protein